MKEIIITISNQEDAEFEKIRRHWDRMREMNPCLLEDLDDAELRRYIFSWGLHQLWEALKDKKAWYKKYIKEQK